MMRLTMLMGFCAAALSFAVPDGALAAMTTVTDTKGICKFAVPSHWKVTKNWKSTKQSADDAQLTADVMATSPDGKTMATLNHEDAGMEWSARKELQLQAYEGVKVIESTATRLWFEADWMDAKGNPARMSSVEVLAGKKVCKGAVVPAGADRSATEQIIKSVSGAK